MTDRLSAAADACERWRARAEALQAAADRSNALARKVTDLTDELATVRGELHDVRNDYGRLCFDEAARDVKVEALAAALDAYYTVGDYATVVRLVKAASAVIGS